MKPGLIFSNLRASMAALFSSLTSLTVVAVFVYAYALAFPSAARGQVLYTFNGTPDGAHPYAGVVADSLGNLYGTTFQGGTAQQGSVYKLTPTGTGTYTETVLYSFQGGTDGSNPEDSLVLDAAGNLYGTTFFGGTGFGGGTVFELTASGGNWTEKILYSFQGGTDGLTPESNVIFDAAGNLYGTTVMGGGLGNSSGDGTVYELSPNSSGGWTETIIHAFSGGTDGANPYRGLVLDSAGNLYGVLETGGTGCNSVGCGIVFEFSPGTGGVWTETVLHKFRGGLDGSVPNSNLTIDSTGSLYGTTLTGGGSTACSQGCGTAFQLVHGSGGTWTEHVMHRFASGTLDGSSPSTGALALDSTGTLYGSTIAGGANGSGIFFELTPGSSGGWGETVKSLPAGKTILAPTGLILGPGGNLFSTLINGGPKENGSVVEVAK